MRQILAIMLMCVAVVACKPQAPSPSAEASSKTQAVTAAQMPMNGNAMNQPVNTNAVQLLDASKDVPKPGEVLYFTYMDKGDGSSAYKIQNDSFATFWFGIEYQAGGKHHYTGFTYATPERFGEDAKHHEPTPDDKVTVGMASFSRNPPGSAKPWEFEGNDESLGDTGAFDHADAFVVNGKVLLHALHGDDFIVAAPTQSTQGGSTISNYEIFARIKDPEDSGWSYLGQVYMGSDNADSCGPDGTEPCAKSTGNLKFVDKGGAMPEIHVEMSGTEVSGPGKTRTLGAQDGGVYVFDAKAKRYNPTKS